MSVLVTSKAPGPLPVRHRHVRRRGRLRVRGGTCCAAPGGSTTGRTSPVPTAPSATGRSTWTKGRGYLEKTIESLKRKFPKDDKAHRGDLMRVMNKNVSPIKAIHELRREMTRP